MTIIDTKGQRLGIGTKNGERRSKEMLLAYDRRYRRISPAHSELASRSTREGSDVQGQKVMFKGSRNGLYINLAEGPTFEVLLEELEDRLRAARGFFRGSEAVVDVGGRVLTTEQLVLLEKKLRSTGGFSLTQVVHEPTEVRGPQGRQGDEARLVRGTLHSGQHIQHDGNVVILGDVNPGAEVVASGDTIVVGRLRGMVHAGAGGDDTAVVIAFRLEPIQLRIGGVIGRSPGDLHARGAAMPEIARLQDGVIIVSEYVPHHSDVKEGVGG